MSKQKRRIWSFAIVALIGASLAVLNWVLAVGEGVAVMNPATFPPANRPVLVQQMPQEPDEPPLRVQDAWQLVYQQLPDFPRENNYVSKETGKVEPNNTLVGRLIRYHLFVKGRPANYRFDWKLTLADYLGATPEFLVEAVYPGGDVLRSNPMERDREVIRQLNRVQREALVQALVNTFTGQVQRPAAPVSRPPENRPSSEVLPQPRPGDAQLLMP